ncbi:hypothetical protein ACNPNM_28145, partial [Klebsiella variicola]
YFHLIILNLNLRGMLMNGIEKLFLELDDKEAMALAQFIKRLTWTEMRACAISDDETYLMKDAIDKLQKALSEEGYAPR